jgi:hypothetical protein
MFDKTANQPFPFEQDNAMGNQGNFLDNLIPLVLIAVGIIGMYLFFATNS